MIKDSVSKYYRIFFHGWSHLFLPKLIMFFNQKNYVSAEGFKVYFDHKDIGIGYKLLTQKKYEKNEIYKTCSLLKEGDTVIDVGAHIGLHTLHYSRAVGKGGHVIAVEPDKRNLQILKKNLDANNCTNVTVTERAVTSNNNEAIIFLNKSNSAFQGQVDYSGEGNTISVNANRLDDIIEKNTTLPKLIKIDIEGSEFQAIESLGKYRPEIIVFEYNPWKMSLFKKNAKNLLNDLIDMGYKLDILSANAGEERTVEEIHHSACKAAHNFTDINLIAILE